MGHAHLKLIKTYIMRPVYVIDVVKNIWDMKGNVITISTKSILLEVLHAAISYFTPILARRKCSGYYTNIIVKITGPDININNTRETFWSIGQEHAYRSVCVVCVCVCVCVWGGGGGGGGGGGVIFEARGFFNSPLWWYKLQFMSENYACNKLSTDTGIMYIYVDKT